MNELNLKETLEKTDYIIMLLNEKGTEFIEWETKYNPFLAIKLRDSLRKIGCTVYVIKRSWSILGDVE